MRRTRETSAPFYGVELSNFEQTCGACPSQWEATGPDGEYVYIRLRHGYFRVDVNGNTEFECAPDGYDGCMSTEDMLKLTGFSIKNYRNADDE